MFKYLSNQMVCIDTFIIFSISLILPLWGLLLFYLPILHSFFFFLTVVKNNIKFTLLIIF